MSAFEFGILGLYFLTLVILAIMGFHRYVMVWLYFKHKDRKAQPAPLPAVLPRVTIQLPDLQRDVRARPAARVGRRRSATRRTGSRSRSSTTRPTRRPRSRAARSSATASSASTSTTCTAPTAPATRRAPSTRASRSATGEFVLIFDADFVAPARHPREDPRPLRRPEGRDGPGALGPHQPRLLAAHRSAVDHARRPLHHGARGAQPRRPLLQLQRHRGRLAPRGDRGRGRAGSTTPSPRTSTSPTGRSCGAGGSCTCRTSSPPPSCRSR